VPQTTLANASFTIATRGGARGVGIAEIHGPRMRVMSSVLKYPGDTMFQSAFTSSLSPRRIPGGANRAVALVRPPSSGRSITIAADRTFGRGLRAGHEILREGRSGRRGV